MSVIFVADDDLEMRRLLVSSLRQQGFEVESAADGKELTLRLDAARARGQAPDLVVADVRMPGLTGLHVLEWARSNLPSVPFVLVTAFGDRRTHARALELGAAAVFDKPFDLNALHRTIAEILSVGEVSADSAN